jgi:integrase
MRNAEKLRLSSTSATDHGAIPVRGEIRPEKWAAEWIQTRHDLRLTTRTRLEITLKVQVLPRFGTTPLVRITNAAVRSWVAEMLAAGLSPSTIRKAVFALRQCLDAAIADNRMATHPAISVPLPSEPLKLPRFLSQSEVERLVGAMPDQYKAMVLVGAYAGLRWGEAVQSTVWRPAVVRAGIPSITFHGLRHSFVAILVAAGCNVREVSEWAGHTTASPSR